MTLSIFNRSNVQPHNASSASSDVFRQKHEQAAPFTVRRKPMEAISQDLNKARQMLKNVRTGLVEWVGMHEIGESGLRYVLDGGAHINQTHGKGYSALHDAGRAHFRPDSRVVSLLLQRQDAHGQIADLTARNDKGDTPIQTAVKHNNIAFLTAVLGEVRRNPSRPVDLDNRNNRGLDCIDQCRSNAARTLIASIAEYKAQARDANFPPPPTDFGPYPSTRSHTASSLGEHHFYSNIG